MNKKRYIKILGLYFIFFSLGTALFILLFHTKVFANVSVFFYRGVLLLMLSSFLVTLALLYFRTTKYGKTLSIKDIILLIVLLFCLNLVFFTHLPVTADRSVSVFLLGYMNSRPEKAFSNKEITDVLIKYFINENKAVDKRLSEQIISHDIVKEKNGYRISDQGKLLMKFYNLIADVFAIEKKNISL
ncbi:MAG: hypothetical protein AAB521_04990 [Patescibacteria group bacterium]